MGINFIKYYAYSWLNKWNEYGIEGLKTKTRSGRPGSLSQNDKKILDEIFIETEFLTTQKAHKIIKDNFNLDFTLKHVRTILHELDYFYSDAYTNESKDDERLLFKITKNSD